MDAVLSQSRSEHLSKLEPQEFVERLETRSKIVNRFTVVVREAVESGEIQSWEFPHIEAMLGIASASVFGTPSHLWGDGTLGGVLSAQVARSREGESY